MFAKFSSSKNSKNKSQEEYLTSSSTVRSRHPKQSASQSQMRGEVLHHTASEEPLQLVPQPKMDLKTRVYHDDGGNEVAMGGREDDDTSQTNLRLHGPGDFEVWREREVVVQVEYTRRPQFDR
jgi:hypothetical protein